MENKLSFGANITCQMERPAIVTPGFSIKSIYDVEHWRKGRLLSKTQDHNLVVTEGLNFLLNVMFGGTTAFDPWNILIFETTPSPALDATSTYVTGHGTDWTECNSFAAPTVRPEYVDAAAAAGVITNAASKAVFTMSDTKTIYGAALVGGAESATVRDVTAGNFIFCAALFGSAKSVVSTDVLNVSITITAADA